MNFTMKYDVRTFIFSLFCVSLLSSAALAVFIGYPRGIGTDGAFYALSGYNLFHGHGFTYSDVPNTFTWPLFSILIGLLSFVISDLQVCAHIVLTLSFALVIFPLYYATRNLFNDQTAVIAASLYAMNGFLLKLSARMTPESLLIVMLLTGVYYTSNILRAIHLNEPQKRTHYVLAGLFFGLCYLVKPEGLQYFIITFIFLMVFSVYRKQLRQEALSLLFCFVVFAAAIAPQILFIHKTTKKWELTTYNHFLFRGMVEPFISLNPGEASADPKMEYNYNAYIVRGPYTNEQFQNDIRIFNDQAMKYAKSLLTIIGPLSLVLWMVFFFRKMGPYSASKRYMLYMLLPLFTIILWYDTKDKFFIVSIPFFIVISSSLLYIVKEKYNNKPYLFYLLFFLIYLQSYTPIANQAPANTVIGNHRKMGEWVRDNMPDIGGKLIADRKPYITYLARGRYFRYNKVTDYKSFVALLKNNKVDYLIVDDFYTQTKNPGVIELLDGKDRNELKFMHVVEDSSWGKAILYRINY